MKPATKAESTEGSPRDRRTGFDRRKILELLQKDARPPDKDLAERVGVAPSTALERVRALRRRGLIAAFSAEVDVQALGRRWRRFPETR